LGIFIDKEIKLKQFLLCCQDFFPKVILCLDRKTDCQVCETIGCVARPLLLHGYNLREGHMSSSWFDFSFLSFNIQHRSDSSSSSHLCPRFHIKTRTPNKLPLQQLL